jgi:hypothetical protein
MAYFRIGSDEVTPDKFFDELAMRAFMEGDSRREEEYRDLSYRFSHRGDIEIVDEECES